MLQRISKQGDGCFAHGGKSIEQFSNLIVGNLFGHDFLIFIFSSVKELVRNERIEDRADWHVGQNKDIAVGLNPG